MSDEPKPEAPEMFALREYLDEIAKSPKKVVRIHMTYPDGTHTADCKGCKP